jgi:hypothetical protein
MRSGSARPTGALAADDPRVQLMQSADAAGAAAIARDLLKEALDARAHAPAKDKEKLTLAFELAAQVCACCRQLL